MLNSGAEYDVENYVLIKTVKPMISVNGIGFSNKKVKTISVIKIVGKIEGSRAFLFEDKERQALTPCPATELVVYLKQVKRKVSKQYLINYDNHLYSVPHQLTGKTVDVKATARQIYCVYDGELCAEHATSSQKGGITMTVLWPPVVLS